MKYSFLALLFLGLSLYAQETKPTIDSPLVEGLAFRNIGPAFTSGRIADIAIHPKDPHTWYVAVGSGNVWKTVNAGTTWEPVFDHQASYSIGCVTIDPSNPSTVWVGTGENVGGRHVGFGDGVYMSPDGGKTWKNMGLKNSEHISKIIVHPTNSNIVFVAAQGPLWSAGGDRGLFKTTDGGKNWTKVLGDEEWTGVTDIAMDPKNPDFLVAATWQHQRTVAAYMGGGPKTAIYRSSDCGTSWEKLSTGLPGSNMGKIGLGISPFDSDIIYAAITLDRRKGGVYVSRDRGSSWTKQSDAVAGGTGPHYYQELYVSPHKEGRIYLADFVVQVSDDHGKTFRLMKETEKHSDNHALVFSADPDYLLVGTDGGLYESFDLAENWRFIGNLPVTQYYKIALDDALPFYNIFGGTQDNGTHAGPSQTIYREGIRNADWQHILGGDGHQTATEPGNPNIVYGESQQGFMFRLDRLTGEQVFIQPQPAKDEPLERFNWDTPILVSAHDHARIYTASYRVWRSENRGDSWTAVSGDLTKGIDRMQLPMMGKQQSWDNAWDMFAMSNYSTITSLGESPVKDGILYAGTDDGLIQVTTDGGKTWKKTELGSIKGVPATAFVNDIRADLFDATTVYAALDNHKYGDFKPYIIMSTNAGASWKLISGTIPDRTLVWRLVQDHVRKELLFAATESGIWFTIDGGELWVRMTGGLPTISFRDIHIQRRENDLVAASFGRGIFILDDLTPLRTLSTDMLSQEALLFPVKDVKLFRPRGVTVSPGASEYKGANPPFGATFTYYLKDDIKSLGQLRKEKEKKLTDAGSGIPFPGWDALEKERYEDKPVLIFAVKDKNGKTLAFVDAPATKGIHRVNWDLRYASANLVIPGQDTALRIKSNGFMATPGTYSVTLYALHKGEMKALTEAMPFKIVPLREQALEPASPEAIEEFRLALEAALREYQAMDKELTDAIEDIKAMKNACFRLDSDPGDLLKEVYQVESALQELRNSLNGTPSKLEIGEQEAPTPQLWFYAAYMGLMNSYGPTQMQKESLQAGIDSMQPVRAKLDELTKNRIPALTRKLQAAGAALPSGH